MSDEKENGEKYPNGCWLYKGGDSKIFADAAAVRNAKKSGWKDTPQAADSAAE